MTNQLKLTTLSSKAGWGCKIGPEDLAQVLRYLPKGNKDDNLLVGMESSDDGSVYKLTEELALIQTVDFFTPIVDDPYMFGQIAAANSLSDVYAMGGVPKTVLNIVAYPMEELGPKVLAEILKGSSDKVKEAGALVVGGHSIDDKEPKFGLSVTGLVHPNKYYKNIGSRPGDVLVLTKPIGIGILTTALKKDLLTKKQINDTSQMMSMLNKYAAEVLSGFEPSAVTDITGFGLLGHAYEMASGSNVSFQIDYKKIPLLSGTKALADKQIFPAGSRTNHAWLKDVVAYSETISPVEELILCDSITSGGLFISMNKDEAEKYVEQLKSNHSIESHIIGKVINKSAKAIYVN